jgi:dimethylglycine dehydrogenase
VRDHCGVLPISGFTRLEVKGNGARAFVDSLTASKLPPPGRVTLAYFPDSRGRIVTEMTVMVHSDDHVGLITAALAQWHDAEVLSRMAPEGITVTDHSDEMECLLITGPKARDILAPLTDGHDLEARWLSVSHEGSVAGETCRLIRVSFAGELGWEVHCKPESAPVIWDALMAAGAKPFGMYALNALQDRERLPRLEGRSFH